MSTNESTRAADFWDRVINARTSAVHAPAGISGRASFFLLWSHVAEGFGLVMQPNFVGIIRYIRVDEVRSDKFGTYQKTSRQVKKKFIAEFQPSDDCILVRSSSYQSDSVIVTATILKSVPLAHRGPVSDNVPTQILHLPMLCAWTHKHTQALIGAGCGASQNRGSFQFILYAHRVLRPHNCSV